MVSELINGQPSVPESDTLPSQLGKASIVKVSEFCHNRLT